MRASSRRLAAAGLALCVVLGAMAAWGWARDKSEKSPLGLFTSLPIYWRESASVSETLDNGSQPHWVRTVLEENHRLLPLDTLDDKTLSGLNELVMAQPRPLAPAENVALDKWVHDGGHLLLFADPMLTEQTRFTLGDKRRPQDVVLLSPILHRWGLELLFDEDQSADEQFVIFGSTRLPTRLAGRLAPAGSSPNCAIISRGLVANCRIGAGTSRGGGGRRVAGSGSIVATGCCCADGSDPAIFWPVTTREITGSLGERSTSSRKRLI